MADTAYDRAVAWLAEQLHETLCGTSGPAAGDQLGALMHRVHTALASDILVGCDVREEWGVRDPSGAETWADSIDDARDWIARAAMPLTLIRRPVITLPATEITDAT